MNTAPVTTALADNGVALVPVVIGGVTLPAGSTAADRLAAHAKAGTQTQFHTDSTVARLGMQSSAAANPAPTPKQLERSNAMPPQGAPSAARQAQLDAELQAAGIQKRPDGSTHKDGEGDPESIAKLTESYRFHAINANSESARDELRASYERDLQRISNGRPLSELEIGIATGEVVRKMQGSKEVKARETAPPVSEHPPQAWAEAHVTVADRDGYIPMERINKNGLSGYTLPKLIDGQTYHVSVFKELAAARDAGMTQKQVDAYIRAGMVRDGWIKA